MFYVLFVRVIIDADGIIRVFHVIMRFFFSRIITENSVEAIINKTCIVGT